MKIKVLFVALICSLAMFSCGHEHQESESMKEAREIQNTLISLSESVEATMLEKAEIVSAKMDTCIANGDTIMADQLGALNNQLSKLQVKLDHWKDQKVSLPHDHSQCDGTHNHEEIVSELSDEEILEIQRELQSQLKEISGEIETITVEEKR